jgi:NAD(P)-dependent dehydrogenase (short-subunit alcohol dehydrogenase family)
MPEQQTVLLLGGTGRTGRRVLERLLSHGVNVRAVVRSTGKLPERVAADPKVRVLEANLLSLSDEELQSQVRGCDTVICCLGHVISFAGIFGPPRDLVTRATARLCLAIESLQPVQPVKYILMSSVSVHHPEGLDTRRGRRERAAMWMLRGLVPPAMDNQRAADFLHRSIGTSHPSIQWVVVRPDALMEGDVSEYEVHERLVSSLFAPAKSNMANVAHFMGRLAADPRTWHDWKGKLPVIINVPSN